jgi:membrane-bound metal-dependent hydrolase YbcI (DUF457 family)
MLPDIDSGPGIPLRESLAFAAAVISTMLVDRFQGFGWSMESIILAAALVYLFIRFAVAELLKRYTVHRGMFHSIPAAVIFGEIAYLLATGDLPLRLYKACAVVAGYMIHLILDETYSVQYVRGRMQLKRSFGTAIKLFDRHKLWPNVSAYAKLALFTFLAFQDQAWMEDFYRQRLEARTHQWTQKLVEYSGKALGARAPQEPDPAGEAKPETAPSPWTVSVPGPASAPPADSTASEGRAEQKSDAKRSWLPRWSTSRDWLLGKQRTAPAPGGAVR